MNIPGRPFTGHYDDIKKALVKDILILMQQNTLPNWSVKNLTF